MKTSSLNLLVRNRKVHLLVLISVLGAVIFHTLHGQGISIQTVDVNPHASELTYSTVLETINLNVVVTDVEIHKCLRGFSCGTPKNSPGGVWVKIPTKLNLYPHTFSFFNYFMYVEKSHGNDAQRFIVDIQFHISDKLPETNAIEGSEWTIHRTSSKLYVHIQHMKVPGSEIPIVRDINILFGAHDLYDNRVHWRFQQTPILLPLKQTIHPHASLLSVSINDEMTIVNTEQEFVNVFKKNEVITTVDPKFKIMQLSDMHIGQDMGNCFDDNCKFDVKTLKFVKNAIETEGDVKLVIITGDMIDFDRSKHFESVVLKALSPVLEARIPFIFTFGDSDYDISNYQTKINVLNFISSLPKCYNKAFKDANHRLHGLTNGNLKVFHLPPAGDQEVVDYNKLNLDDPNAIITVLDSENQEVDTTQSTYLYRVGKGLKDDVIKLLFLHYPLPNFRPEGKFKLIGSYNEKHTLTTKTDKQFLLDVKATKYRAISVGHEHENDLCLWNEDKEGTKEGTILLCYSGVTGDGGNTRLDKDFERRMRIFEIDFEKNLILSWKRRAKNGPLDPQEIYAQQSPA